MSVRERLPQEYVTRMRRQLGEEAQRFLDCYEEDARAGIRVNTGKLSIREAQEKLPFLNRQIPWTRNGFYVEKGAAASGHPYYYAGLYYLQEPSAMLPASVLPVVPGDRVLDLCAAPGGKATELALRLEGRGLLVANDVSASRAKALLKNLNVWGASNICVTAETPQRLLESFGCYFDKILVDAPCSGEGMFRKDDRLISSWRQKGPGEYAPLQKEILSCAVQMLRPGGMLVYSTCTFSEEEDEEVVADVLSRFPEMELLQPRMEAGFLCGRTLQGCECKTAHLSLERCVRIYPHRVEGEGHFLALMRKQCTDTGDFGTQITDVPSGNKKPSGKDGLWGGMKDTVPGEVQEFLSDISSAQPVFEPGNYRYVQMGEQCLFLPPYQLPEGLRYLRTGLLLGSYRRGRFEPSQALAMVLHPADYPSVLNLAVGDERVRRYLKGETLELSSEEAAAVRPWVLVCADGFSLGWGRSADGRLKNKYHPGWRMQ